MPTCLGVDSSLNSTGLCLYGGDPSIIAPELSTLRPPKDLTNQLLKILWQRDMIRYNVQRVRPQYLSIEIPYQLPFQSRSAGGQQSSNLYALYSMVIDVAREQKIPIACFHISQLRSLIHHFKGATKDDTISLAKSESLLSLNEHEADAFFIAKYGLHFWNLYEGQHVPLPPVKLAIFLSKELTSKKRPQGMLYRPGDAWFDFRSIHPLEAKAWQEQPSPKQSNI